MTINDMILQFRTELRDPEVAVEYLSEVLHNGDDTAIRLALIDVAQARGINLSPVLSTGLRHRLARN